MANEKISELTEKITPVDTDLLAVVDTESSPIETKRSTWANIKATLKAHFDTLYEALGGGGDYALQRTLKTGDYYSSLLAVGGPGLAASTWSANQLRAIAFPIPRDMTFDRIGILISTAVAGNLRLGIYNNGTNNYPGTLLEDAGAVDTSTLGLKERVISQPLAKGLYWLAFVHDAASLGYWRYTTFQGVMDDWYGTHPCIGWTKAFTYAALPDTFPDGASADGGCFAVCMRLASLD